MTKSQGSNSISIWKRSRSAQLINLIEQIETRPKADAVEAARVVSLLLKSYPPRMTANAPEPSKEYMGQLTTLCTGIELTLLRTMIDPREGILAKHKFLPSIAEVVEWLDQQTSHTTLMLTHYKSELKQLGEEDMVPVPSKGERERRMKVLEGVKEKIKSKSGMQALEWLKPEEEQSAKEIAERKRFEKTQVNDRAGLRQALQNLENSLRANEGVEDER